MLHNEARACWVWCWGCLREARFVVCFRPQPGPKGGAKLTKAFGRKPAFGQAFVLGVADWLEVGTLPEMDGTNRAAFARKLFIPDNKALTQKWHIGYKEKLRRKKSKGSLRSDIFNLSVPEEILILAA